MIQNRKIIIPDSCPLNFESIGSLLYNVAPYNQKWHRGDKINLQIYSDDSGGLSLLILDKRDVFVKEILFEDFKTLNGYRYANLSYEVDLKNGAYYFIIKDVTTQAWLARTPMNEIGFFRNTSYLEATNDVNDFGTIVQDTTPVYSQSGVAPKRYFGDVYGTGSKQLFNFTFNGGGNQSSGVIGTYQFGYHDKLTKSTGKINLKYYSDTNIYTQDGSPIISPNRACIVRCKGTMYIDYGKYAYLGKNFKSGYIEFTDRESTRISITEDMISSSGTINWRITIPVDMLMTFSSTESVTSISYYLEPTNTDSNTNGFRLIPDETYLLFSSGLSSSQSYYDDFYYIIENQVSATAKLISSTGVELDCTNEVIDGVNYLKSPDIRTLTGGMYYHWKITRQDGSIVISPGLMASYNSTEGKFGVPSLSSQLYNPYDKMQYIVANEVSATISLVSEDGTSLDCPIEEIDGEFYSVIPRLDILTKLGKYKLVVTYLDGSTSNLDFLYANYNDTIGWFCDNILENSTRFNYGESEFIISTSTEDNYIYVTCEQNSVNYNLVYTSGSINLYDEFDNLISNIPFSNNDDTWGMVFKKTGIEINKKLYIAILDASENIIAQSDYFYYLDRKIYTQSEDMYQCNIRVEAHVDPDSDEYKADISDYIDQEGDNISVYNLPTTTYTWYVGENNGVPVWMRKKLNLYLQFKELRLNFENVTKANGEQTFKQEQKIEKTGMSILSMKFQERETTYVSSEIIALGNMNRLLSFNGKILKT